VERLSKRSTGRPQTAPIDMERARELVYQKGLSLRETARVLGVHHNTLIKRFASEPRRKKRWEKRGVIPQKASRPEQERAPSDASRRCAGCGQTKPADQFSVRNRRKGYRSSYCKPCNSERTKAYNRQHPERIKENNRRFAEANPERIREYSRSAHARHKDKRNAYHRERRAQDPERFKQYCRDWHSRNRERHLEKMREYNALHRGRSANDLLRKINALVPLNISDREEIVSNMMLALYEGDIKPKDINRAAVSAFIRQHLEGTSTASRYGHLSLDAPVAHDATLTLGETIAAHYR
jgi:hypothetical protein